MMFVNSDNHYPMSLTQKKLREYILFFSRCLENIPQYFDSLDLQLKSFMLLLEPDIVTNYPHFKKRNGKVKFIYRLTDSS